jgi:hypothetical protein
MSTKPMGTLDRVFLSALAIGFSLGAFCATAFWLITR